MAYPYSINPAASDACTDRLGGKVRVFKNGTDLYTFGREVSAITATFPVHCFKSTDAGANWAKVDDGNAPVVVNNENLSAWQGMPSSMWPVLKTGSSTVVLLPYCAVVGGVYGELQFIEFDMATDTWGVPVTGGPTVIGCDVTDYPARLVIGQYCPATGDYVFLFQARVDAVLPAPRSYAPVFTDIVIYNGGWGAAAPFAGTAGDTHNSLPRDILVDPVTSKCHFFWVTQDWGSTAIQFQKLYHQLYDPNTTTMGAPELIPTGTGVYGEVDAGLAAYGAPNSSTIVTGFAILTSGNYIAFPYIKDRATPNQAQEPWPQSMVVAALADSPSWTEYPVTATTTDHITTGPYGVGGWGVMDAGGGVIRGYWSNPYGLGFYIQTADFNIGALAWGAVGIAYTHATNRFGDYLSVSPGSANVLATDKDAAPATNQALSFWKFAGASPYDLIGVAPVGSGAGAFNGGAVIIGSTPIPPVPPGGWPVWPPVFRIPNYYDKCLEAFKCHVQRYPMQDASRCVEMLELWSGNDVPRESVEFWKAFKVTTPAPGETLVGGFRVPTGYSGMLYGIHLGYTGTGFVDGSGDIFWRVMIGNAWAAKGLGNVSVRLGAANQCLQLTDYIKLKSNQLIQVWVNVPNTSGNIQVGASRILATLQGWYYPL